VAGLVSVGTVYRQMDRNRDQKIIMSNDNRLAKGIGL